MKQFLLAFLLLFVIQANSQDLKITDSNNNTKSVNGKLLFNDDGFIDTILINEETSNYEQPLNNIKSIIDGDKKYIIKNYNNKNYAFETLIDNNLSLYKSKNKYFLKSEEFSFREIPFNEKDGFTFKTFNAGVLGVFVNKCKESQNYIHKNFNNINIAKLRDIVTSFNTCDLNNSIEISNQSIENANKPNEKIQFGVTVGNSFLNADYNGISVDHTESYSLFNIGLAIYFRPNILNRKLYYKFSVNYMNSEEGAFFASTKNVRARHGYIETVLGVNYLFLEANSKLNPYIGINGGMLFNNGSKVTLNPSIAGQPVIHYTSTSALMYNVNAGLFFEVLNQKFDLNLSYLPSTKVSLNTATPGESKSYHNLDGFNIRLAYYF